MKRSISHLPKRKQEDLHRLVGMVLERIPQTQMIILYGSYARGDYVEYDKRIEFGIPTSFTSDYDILVVTHRINDKSVSQMLSAISQKYTIASDYQTPVQFINDDIKKLNSDLAEGRYFYSNVKKEGILLYDSGKYKLARRRKLKFHEIQKQAKEYFEEKYQRAESFLDLAQYADSKKDFAMASFLLHQACENLFHATRLTFTQDSKKQHDLEELLDSVKKYSDEFVEVFPRRTAEEKRFFELLKAAYVEGRYNPKFLVTKEDIDALTPIVRRLFDLVKRVCEQRIREYGEMK